MKDLAAPSPRMALATGALLTAIWGTTWAGVRLSLDGYPPLMGVALRFALASAVLFVLAKAWQVDLTPTRRRVGVWLVQAICAFGVSYGLVYWAEQWVPSGLVSVLFSTFPLFVTLLAWFTLPGERLHRRGLLGVVIGFAGIVVLFSEDLTSFGGPEVRHAALVVLLAPASAAFSQIAVRRWGRDLHSLTLTAPPMAMAAVGMAGLSWWLEAEREVPMGLVPTLAVLYLALLGSAVTFTLYFWLLRYVDAVRVSLIAYGTPVVAVAIGTAFLDEPLTSRMVLGAVLVLAGMAFVSGPKPATAEDAEAT